MTLPGWMRGRPPRWVRNRCTGRSGLLTWRRGQPDAGDVEYQVEDPVQADPASTTAGQPTSSYKARTKALPAITPSLRNWRYLVPMRPASLRRERFVPCYHSAESDSRTWAIVCASEKACLCIWCGGKAVIWWVVLSQEPSAASFFACNRYSTLWLLARHRRIAVLSVRISISW